MMVLVGSASRCPAPRLMARRSTSRATLCRPAGFGDQVQASGCRLGQAALVDRAMPSSGSHTSAGRTVSCPPRRSPARGEERPVRPLGGGLCSRRSVAKDRPADRVASGLVLEDEFPDPLVKKAALPVPLDPTRARFNRGRCAHGFDRIGGGTEVMLGYVTHARRMTRGVGRVSTRPVQRASRTHRQSTASPRSHHLHVTRRPTTCRLDRVSWPRVRWPFVLKQVENVLRALRSPQGQAPVVRISERATPADGDQTRIADLWQDHANSLPVSVTRRVATFGAPPRRCRFPARRRTPSPRGPRLMTELVSGDVQRGLHHPGPKTTSVAVPASAALSWAGPFVRPWQP